MAKRVRKGRKFTNRWGTEVIVGDHEWTPPQAKRGSMGQSRADAGQQIASLQTLATNPESYRPKPVISTIVHRFSFGFPVEEKSDWLDTEIGRVDFTEDLVVGFDDHPSPINKKEAWDMIAEAAERYARLTAFIAAEQGVTCEKLCEKDQPHPPLSGGNYHPAEVMGAVRRYRGESETGDAVVDSIIAELDGSVEEDPKVLVEAAKGHHWYLTENRQILTFTPDNAINPNLLLALRIVEGSQESKDFSGGKPFDGRDAFDSSLTFDAARHESNPFISDVDMEAMMDLEKNHQRSSFTPFVERFHLGVRVNLTDALSIEVDDTGQFPMIRRVYRNGKEEVVLESAAWTNGPNSTKTFLLAADFRRPFSSVWQPNNMVGFSHRKEK